MSQKTSSVICIHCGKKYRRPDLIFGILHCPFCYGIVPRQKPKKIKTYDNDLDYFLKDQKNIKKCLNCPYEVCIAGIAEKELAYLRQYNNIISTYKLYDKGNAVAEISQKLNIDKQYIYDWIYRKKRIMYVFSKHGNPCLFNGIEGLSHCKDYG